MQKPLSIKPEQAIAIADQLINSGRHQQALQSLLQAYNQAPKNERLALKLARLLQKYGQSKDALIILNRTYHLGTKTFELGYFLAALLQLEHHHPQAENIIKQCLAENPRSAEAYNLLGTTLIEQNKYTQGIEAYLESIRLKPASADAHNNLAWAYRASGEKQKAIHHFEQAFEIDASATEALSGLLLLKTFKEKAKEFDAVEALIKSPSLSTKQKIELEFALGKAYEDIKDYSSAFRHFKHANRTWRKNLSYSLSEDDSLFSRIKDCFNSEFVEKMRQQNLNSDNAPQPIFVLGMPRSSTTLIEQILSSHSKVVGGGELPFLEPLIVGKDKQLKWHKNMSMKEISEIRSSYQQSMLAHVKDETTKETRFITDKLPQNFRFIGAILALFPNAKIVHCKRQAMDTCLSLYKHHFPMSNHHYSYDLKELGGYYNLYEELMAYWHNLSPGQILDVQYEELLDNFEQGVKTILNFCDLDFENTCLEFEKNTRIVRTASSDQVRQGLYKNAAGRWLMYEEELAELKTSLRSYS